MILPEVKLKITWGEHLAVLRIINSWHGYSLDWDGRQHNLWLGCFWITAGRTWGSPS